MRFRHSRPSRRDALVLGASVGLGAVSPLLRAHPLEAAERLDKQRIEVVGNTLQVGGQPIRLVGIAMADPVYVRASSTLDDYRIVAQDWGANAVRISIHPGHWRENRTNCLTLLKRDVAAARAQGMWVVLDWHAIGFPGRYAEKVDPSWGLVLDAFDSDEPLAVDFWDAASREFGADPGILFELWNEPVYDGKHWKNTGEHWVHLKPLWQRLIAVIRRHSDNIIIAAGGRWAHDLGGIARDPLADPRVVYAWHCYPKEAHEKPDAIEEALAGLPAVKPVLVTEWGFCRSCDAHLRGTPENFGRPFVFETLERYKLHSFAWVYSWGATPPLLERNGQPNEFGRFVRTYIRSAWRPERVSKG